MNGSSVIILRNNKVNKKPIEATELRNRYNKCSSSLLKGPRVTLVESTGRFENYRSISRQEVSSLISLTNSTILEAQGNTPDTAVTKLCEVLLTSIGNILNKSRTNLIIQQKSVHFENTPSGEFKAVWSGALFNSSELVFEHIGGGN